MKIERLYFTQSPFDFPYIFSALYENNHGGYWYDDRHALAVTAFAIPVQAIENNK
ncbi:MAG: hypothetical protein PUK05_04340 [Peptoniphilaceae bacterium]|nr:hypothetical protein [Peptoniphilaceae bacterium]